MIAKLFTNDTKTNVITSVKKNVAANTNNSSQIFDNSIFKFNLFNGDFEFGKLKLSDVSICNIFSCGARALLINESSCIKLLKLSDSGEINRYRCINIGFRILLPKLNIVVATPSYDQKKFCIYDTSSIANLIDKLYLPSQSIHHYIINLNNYNICISGESNGVPPLKRLNVEHWCDFCDTCRIDDCRVLVSCHNTFKIWTFSRGGNDVTITTSPESKVTSSGNLTCMSVNDDYFFLVYTVDDYAQLKLQSRVTEYGSTRDPAKTFGIVISLYDIKRFEEVKKFVFYHDHPLHYFFGVGRELNYYKNQQLFEIGEKMRDYYRFNLKLLEFKRITPWLEDLEQDLINLIELPCDKSIVESGRQILLETTGLYNDLVQIILDYSLLKY